MSSRGVIDLYASGMSIPQVSSITGLARSTVRHHCKRLEYCEAEQMASGKQVKKEGLGKAKERNALSAMSGSSISVQGSSSMRMTMQEATESAGPGIRNLRGVNTKDAQST